MKFVECYKILDLDPIESFKIFQKNQEHMYKISEYKKKFLICLENCRTF